MAAGTSGRARPAGSAGRSSGGRGAGARTKAATTKVSIPTVSWREVEPTPVILVAGAETFFAQAAITHVRRTLLAENPDLEVTEIDATSYVSGALATAVSPSLFLEPRFVIIDSVERCTDALIDDGVAYLDQVVEGTTVVFRHAKGQRGKRLLDAIRACTPEVAAQVLCEPLKANELMEFVMSEFRAARRKIVPTAAAQLVAAFNHDLEQLAGACRQLCSTTTDLITEDVVDATYGGRVETTGFKIADVALAGRAGDALTLARHGFASGVHPVLIVSTCASKLRVMARVAGRSGSDAQLASIAGAAPWQVGQARRDLRGFDDDSLARAVELVADTDLRVKGASRDAEFAVERMLVRLANRDFAMAAPARA